MACREYDAFEIYNPDACKDEPSKFRLYHKYNVLIDYNRNYDLDNFLEVYPEYVDKEQFANIVGVSLATLNGYIKRNILPPPIKSKTIINDKISGFRDGAKKKYYWDMDTVMDWFHNMKDILDAARKNKWSKYGNYCEYHKGKCNNEKVKEAC